MNKHPTAEDRAFLFAAFNEMEKKNVVKRGFTPLQSKNTPSVPVEKSVVELPGSVERNRERQDEVHHHSNHCRLSLYSQQFDVNAPSEPNIKNMQNY